MQLVLKELGEVQQKKEKNSITEMVDGYLHAAQVNFYGAKLSTQGPHMEVFSFTWVPL